MFYIEPPKGLAALHTLEETVITRLQYLEALYYNKTNEFQGNIGCLLEGSTQDAIGHFVLRLLSSTSPEFFSYWLMRETLLFKHRLGNLSFKQLNRFFRKIMKNVSQECNRELEDEAVLKLSTHYLRNSVFHHIIKKDHALNCTDFYVQVDFELVPDLVSTQKVALQKGQAIIYCSQWKEALISLFQTYINRKVFGLHLIKIPATLQDSRLISLNQRIQYGLLARGLSFGQITAGNINLEAKKFPPCMRHLHSVLRQRHRLSHYARFYYTLFLKECGMKVEDSLEYWKAEYSKPHVCGSACNHNWQKDSRKFVYSIRHTYGLEGGRKNYTSQSCSSLCRNVPGPNYEGGCPFKDFDTNALHAILSSAMPEGQVATFMQDIAGLTAQKACTKLLKLNCKNVEDDFVMVRPVQYYMKMIKPI